MSRKFHHYHSNCLCVTKPAIVWNVSEPEYFSKNRFKEYRIKKLRFWNWFIARFKKIFCLEVFRNLMCFKTIIFWTQNDEKYLKRAWGESCAIRSNPISAFIFAFSTIFYFTWQLFDRSLRFWKSQIPISLKMTSKSSLWDPNKVIQSCNEVQVGPESLRLDFYQLLNFYDIFLP